MSTQTAPSKRLAAQSDFDQQAQQAQSGTLAELWHFLATNKKWWLAPIVGAMLLLGALVILGGTGAAPFIYTLF